MKKFSVWLITTGAFCLAFLVSASALATNAGITYHGRIVKPDGTSLENPNVQFRLQIRTPNASNCLMYQEQQNMNMVGTNGVFSLTINDGTGTRQDTSGYTLERIFANRGTFTLDPSVCGATNTFAPGSSDGRKLVVSFNDGSGWEDMPATNINFIPNAIDAIQVGGFKSDSLLRVQDGSGDPQNATPLSPANFTELLALINGTSSQYSKAGQLGGQSLPALSANQSLGWTGSGWQAITPITTETDPSVKSFAKSNLPVCGANQFLKDDGSGGLTCATASGTAGGTVTQVDAGTGLTGGPITSTGTLSLANVNGSGATATKITYDVYGRVTASSNITGDDITSGTIGGSTTINTTGTVYGSALSTQALRVYESTNTYRVSILSPVGLSSNYNLTLPVSAGSSGQVLSTDGSGGLSWVSQSTGSVTGVTGTAPISVTGSGALTVSVADGSTSAKGVVQLAIDGQNAANVVVQGNDSRLSDSRAPSGGAGGDLTGFYPNPTIAKLATTPLTITSLASGNYLKYNGTAWVNANLSGAEITTALGYTPINAGQMPGNCAANQTLTFTSPTGTWNCSDIAITGSAFGSQSQNLVFASPNGSSGAPTFRALASADIPTLNQNTTGTAANVTGVVAVANGGTGQTTQQAAINSLTGTQSAGKYLRSDGTNATLASIQVSDVPTLNQNTTGTAANVTGTVAVANGGTGVTSLPGTFVLNGGQAGAVALGSTDSNSVTVKTNNSAALTILPNGNVGIDTAAPGQKLEVNGTIKATDLILTSDARAKKNIVSLDGDDSLEKICRVRPVAFDWRADGRKDLGVIAQEVRKVFPQLVIENPDGTLAVKYQSLIAPLIGSVQELNSRNEELRNRVDELEARNRELQRTVDLILRRLATEGEGQ